jgi:glycerol kinase
MRSDSGLPIAGIKVDGGASENNFLMQFQADISEAHVERGRLVETTALGAAYLAGLAVSYWSGEDDIIASRRGSRLFTPDMEEGQREALISGWRRAVESARSFSV